MMGAHIYQDDAPKMCFNGAKSWYLGWYQNRHVSINPNNPWHGKLVGIQDYLDDQTSRGAHFLVAKIGNLFVMYNRMEGVNSQVAGDGDKVTIVEQDGSGSQSWLLKALGTNEIFKRNNLFIKVCERSFGEPDFARVLVYTQNGSSPPITCGDPLTTESEPTNNDSFASCREFDNKRKQCTATAERRRRCRWKRSRRNRRRRTGRCLNR